MDIPLISHMLNGLLMVAIPVILALGIRRLWNIDSRIWWIGAATFILSQIGHIPFNWVVSRLLNRSGMVAWDQKYQFAFNVCFMGLSAGIFEEVTRYLVLRWWAKDIRTWRKSVFWGAGHGGAEAIILGMLVIYAFFQLMAIRNADLAKIFPPAQVEIAQKQVSTYWSATWYDSLLGAVERLLTIPCQIAMAVIVLRVFIRKKIYWLFLAIGYHALMDAVGVLSLQHYGKYWTEAIIAGFAILSLIMIISLRSSEPQVDSLSGKALPPFILQDFSDEQIEKLDKTRYE
jgi:uncharacterized membrane protein YhfC